jgi:hypothetical protein
MSNPEIKVIPAQYNPIKSEPIFLSDLNKPTEYSQPEQEIISKILEIAPGVIGEVIHQPGNEQRPGGCLVIWKQDKTQPLFYEVGTMTKPDKYPIFAFAKANLLKNYLPKAQLSGENLLLKPDQRFMLEYNNQPFDVPHGAVRCNDGWIISFSGFEQEWDAGAVLAISVKSGIMRLENAEQIAEQSIPVSQGKTIQQCFNKLIPQ